MDHMVNSKVNVLRGGGFPTRIRTPIAFECISGSNVKFPKKRDVDALSGGGRKGGPFFRKRAERYILDWGHLGPLPLN